MAMIDRADDETKNKTIMYASALAVKMAFNLDTEANRAQNAHWLNTCFIVEDKEVPVISPGTSYAHNKHKLTVGHRDHFRAQHETGDDEALRVKRADSFLYSYTEKGGH
jgi:hypothetical protein